MALLEASGIGKNFGETKVLKDISLNLEQGEALAIIGSPRPRQNPPPAMPLDELLRWSDIVSIHAPLNDRTRGLVGARELALMKPSALLINVARGGIVDEQALADALDNKRLAGAGIDVFSREHCLMSPDNPLLRVTDPDRLLLSPHTAWAPVEALETLVGCIERNIETFLAEQR